jgi:PKD repeat protein
LWDFGDGGASAEQNPQHLFATSGTYTVCLTTSNGITSDTHCEDIRILSSVPEIILSVSSLSNSCSEGANAPQQHFTVKNGGMGTLNYFVTDNASWLSCSPLTGSSTGEEDVLTLSYGTARMAPGTYFAKVTITASGAANSPQYVNIALTIGDGGLSQINLTGPWDGESLTAPPTFSWTTDGGSRNAYSVDISLTPGGSWYSTYTDLKLTITASSFTLPLKLWNKVSSGARIYWRVRGTDLDVEPRTVVTSDEVYSFYKM